MNHPAIVLAGLILLLGLGASPARAGSYIDSTLAADTGRQEPLRNDQESEATLVFNADSVVDDDGIGAGQAATVVEYSLGPRVSIDVLCRRLPADDDRTELVREPIVSLTQNLMLGFSYKF